MECKHQFGKRQINVYNGEECVLQVCKLCEVKLILYHPSRVYEGKLVNKRTLEKLNKIN